MGNHISFVSDMTISKSELIIAYGAGDAESRTFIVKVRDVEHYFSDWKNWNPLYTMVLHYTWFTSVKKQLLLKYTHTHDLPN